MINDGTGYRQDLGNAGNTVHQMLSNFQGEDQEGGGYMKVLTFDQDSDIVNVESYSPYIDEWDTENDQIFEINLSI